MKKIDDTFSLTVSHDIFVVLIIALDYCLRNEEHFRKDCGVTDLAVLIVRVLLDKTHNVFTQPLLNEFGIKSKSKIIN